MKILLTGGAGFIGSNLLKRLLDDKRIGEIRILDDLSNSTISNISQFLENNNVTFIKEDIRNLDVCIKASAGVDFIIHLAALGSVPRSVDNPIPTNEVNVDGTLNIFHAAKLNKVKRVIFASSSSVYGDSEVFPRTEKHIGNQLSPYAASKYVTELYAKAFALNYDFEYIGLRFFNVYGYNQSPEGSYAAAIPKFITAILNDQPITIYGDGLQSRDFTFINNVLDAIMVSLFVVDKEAVNQIYNVGCGRSTNLRELVGFLGFFAGKIPEIMYLPAKPSEVKTSQANMSKAAEILKLKPKIFIFEGLKQTFEYYKNRISEFSCFVAFLDVANEIILAINIYMV